MKLDRILSSFENKSKYEKVQVEIFNYGKSDVSDIVLELWQDGKLISREYVGASLKSMESFKYTFTARADCSQTGEHEIVVRNVTPGDERLAPETITANVVNADMSSGEYGESSSHIFDNEQITKVQIGDFVNETEAATSGYSDFTAQKVDLRKGDELDVTVTCAGDYPNVGIWIDWNVTAASAMRAKSLK